jgi:hypothetical protein
MTEVNQEITAADIEYDGAAIEHDLRTGEITPQEAFDLTCEIGLAAFKQDAQSRRSKRKR